MAEPDVQMLDYQEEIKDPSAQSKTNLCESSIELRFVDVHGNRLQNIRTLNSKTSDVPSLMDAIKLVLIDGPLMEALECLYDITFPQDLVFVDVKIYNGKDYSTYSYRWTHNASLRINVNLWQDKKALLKHDDEKRETLGWPCPRIEFVVGNWMGILAEPVVGEPANQ